MLNYRMFTLPNHTETAIGYLSHYPRVRWLAILRNENNKAMWDNGTHRGYLPPLVFNILGSIWGRIEASYAYLLDLEERTVQVASIPAVDIFFSEVGQYEALSTLLAGDRERNRLIRELWQLAESPMQNETHWVELGIPSNQPPRQPVLVCRCCFNGYQWFSMGGTFVICSNCAGTPIRVLRDDNQVGHFEHYTSTHPTYQWRVVIPPMEYEFIRTDGMTDMITEMPPE